MTVPNDALATMPPLPYDVVRTLVRDGDILLCSSHEAASRLIRWATKSDWSHCTIAFRMDQIDRVTVLECVERLGVRAVPLSDFISRTSAGVRPYPGKILLARHEAAARFEPHELVRGMCGFAFDQLRRRFSQAETIKIGFRIALGRLGVVLPNRVRADDEFICSEYVARCFASAGVVIEWDGLGFMAPADIAADPAVAAVAQLQTREIQTG